MGRQVNFYMLADDLAEFEKAVSSKEQILFVKSRLSTPEIETFETLAVPEMGKTPLLLYLVRQKDVGELVIKSVAQNHWKIDLLYSPAVELMRSYYDEQIARRGRLYFQPGFYDSNDHWLDKPQEFTKWANSLLNWVRRNYKRDPALGTRFYVGPRMWERTSEGKIRLEPN